MKFYAEMKPTNSPWLGEVPAHWEVSRFRFEAVINGGQVDPREEPWSRMTLIAPNHIESNTGKIIGVETAEEQGADSGKYLVAQGQLVYSKIRPALNKAAIAETEALCSADMYGISFADKVEPRFALYYFLARPFHTFATIISMRVKMPKVNREELADAPWLVPPLDEQCAIADYLDRETARIDTLIEEQQQLIGMLSERRAAVISSALAPTDSWTCHRIKHIGETSLGKMLDAGRAIRDGDQPRAYVRAADVRADGSVNLVDLNEMPFSDAEMEVFDLRAGDVLLIEGGATVGRPGFMVESAPGIAFQKTVNRLRVGPRVDARFVYWSMLRLYESAYYANHYGSVSFVHLTGEKLREIELHLPPLDEQQAIATYLDEQTAKIDALIAETRRFIELARERRSALITAAVTGQIDVQEMM
ncbi:MULTISPECIES: restriction endonuclease subunit S [unclassified Nocardia]|uniref:restriction endonuclease subunit S n=1 Tax=unclassified Nocardia TaxID=2637762 RepID=UPI00037571C6|nr:MULTISPECIES: restriction endonuclease subunit S [unclassified Nocardia]MCX4097666.1 restriction endonuclease subunit S [Nocardia sp. alder85J]